MNVLPAGSEHSVTQNPIALPCKTWSLCRAGELDSASLHLARVRSHDSLRHIRIFVHASMMEIFLYRRLPCSLLPEHYTMAFGHGMFDALEFVR